MSLEALRGIRTISIRGGDPAEGRGRSKGEDNRRGEEVPTRLVDPKGSADDGKRLSDGRCIMRPEAYFSKRGGV